MDLQLIRIMETYLRHQALVVQNLDHCIHELSGRHLDMEHLTTFLHRDIDGNQCQENHLWVVLSELALECSGDIHCTERSMDKDLRVGF